MQQPDPPSFCAAQSGQRRPARRVRNMLFAVSAAVAVAVPVLADGHGDATLAVTASSRPAAFGVAPPAVTSSESATAVESSRRTSRPSFTTRSTPAARPTIARFGNVALFAPSDHVELVGFHQASSTTSIALQPGGESVLLPSRGRGTDARSAVDVAVRRDTQILSPVGGTVVQAESYWLYGEHHDSRVRIRPDVAPDLIVSVLHISGLQVNVGDTVFAGQPIAERGTLFEFESQIDRIAGRFPHVHIEVTPYDPDKHDPS